MSWEECRQGGTKISSLLDAGPRSNHFSWEPRGMSWSDPYLFSPAPCLMSTGQAVVGDGARIVLLQKKAFRFCWYQHSWPHFCRTILSLLSGRTALETSPASGRCLWLRMNNRQPSKASRMSWEPRRRASRRSRGRRCWRARRAAGSSRRDSSLRSSSGNSGAGMAGSVT